MAGFREGEQGSASACGVLELGMPLSRRKVVLQARNKRISRYRRFSWVTSTNGLYWKPIRLSGSSCG
jgi:hypothetical protein